jgi:hypothetical protein
LSQEGTVDFLTGEIDFLAWPDGVADSDSPLSVLARKSSVSLVAYRSLVWSDCRAYRVPGLSLALAILGSLPLELFFCEQ